MRVSIRIARGAPLVCALLLAFTTMRAQELAGDALVASLYELEATGAVRVTIACRQERDPSFATDCAYHRRGVTPSFANRRISLIPLMKGGVEHQTNVGRLSNPNAANW